MTGFGAIARALLLTPLGLLGACGGGGSRTAAPVASAVSLPVSLKVDVHGNALLLAGRSPRRYDVATDTWGAPRTVGGEASFPPVLALDNEGNAMLAWS